MNKERHDHYRMMLREIKPLLPEINSKITPHHYIIRMHGHHKLVVDRWGDDQGDGGDTTPLDVEELISSPDCPKELAYFIIHHLDVFPAFF